MVEDRRSGCPGGHASLPQGPTHDKRPTHMTNDPQGLISDRKASDLEPALSGTTGSAECGLHVMVKQARDRQFEYLNAQQGVLEDESSDEF